MLKATSVPQTPQTNHSQYSSTIGLLNIVVDSKSQPVDVDNASAVRRKNLIIDSKSQPVDLDNSTAVEAKEQLAIILFCGF